MTALPKAVFALLVAATFAAFFVAQRLKHDPSPVQQYLATPVFSPNGDGRKDAERINFKLRREDDVTIDVIDARGDVVRELVDERRLKAYHQTRFNWDGRTDAKKNAPDGRYRMRITLRREGRSLVIPGSFVLDTEPPKVRVTSIGPKPKTSRPIPKLLPAADGQPARVRFSGPTRTATATVYRTGPGRIERMFGPSKIPDGVRIWRWDGKLSGGRAAPPGTYVVVIAARDIAGNIGTSIPMDERTDLPKTGFGTPFPGRGGITVRKLGVLPPNVPTVGGALGLVKVDARGNPYDWSLRRVGGPRRPARRGTRSRPFLNLHAPPGISRLFLLSVRANGAQQRVPYPVQANTDKIVAGDGPGAPHGVLVILPAITWQGRNPIDDDGDGLPDTLDRGLPVRLQRVYSGDGLPVGFARNEGPLMAYLDGRRHRYDLTTDIALTTSTGPDLRRYKGVLIAGDARWLPTGVGRELRAFARRGGTVVSTGTNSLRREVRRTPGQRLIDPTPPAPTDLFGARIGPVVRDNAKPIENIQDEIGLFKGGTGTFSGFDAYEPTLSVGSDAEKVAAAVDAEGKPVIVAARFGKGLIVRTGLPGFASHLGRDRNAAALMERLWRRLSR